MLTLPWLWYAAHLYTGQMFRVSGCPKMSDRLLAPYYTSTFELRIKIVCAHQPFIHSKLQNHGKFGC